MIAATCRLLFAGLWLAAGLLATVGSAPAGATGIADPSQPFTGLAGWWGGEGRLQFKDGKLEQVKCRATYFVSQDGIELKQTIRCASGGGKIEVTSQVRHDKAGKLAGTWTETVYNVSGDLAGEVTARGFRVTVQGKDSPLSANMDIIVRDNKQIVEIQFFSETLIGLTLLLAKG